MNDVDDKLARERLRRLDAMLDGPDDEELFGPEDDVPSIEETRAAVEEMGVDVAAAVAQVRGRIAALDPGQAGEVAVPGEGGRRARRRRQMVGVGAAMIALAAAFALWWVAHPEEADLLGNGRASASAAMGVGAALVRARAISAAPSSSASTPDAGMDGFGSGPGLGLRNVVKRTDR